jgi:hypothetical protein
MLDFIEKARKKISLGDAFESKQIDRIMVRNQYTQANIDLAVKLPQAWQYFKSAIIYGQAYDIIRAGKELRKLAKELEQVRQRLKPEQGELLNLITGFEERLPDILADFKVQKRMDELDQFYRATKELIKYGEIGQAIKGLKYYESEVEKVIADTPEKEVIMLEKMEKAISEARKERQKLQKKIDRKLNRKYI